jgi:hypothetical protein
MPAVRGSASGIPAASRSGSRQKITVPENPNKKYIIYGAVGVVGLILMVVLFKGSKSPPPADATVAAASDADKKRDEPAVKPVPVPVVAAPVQTVAPTPVAAAEPAKVDAKTEEKTNVTKTEPAPADKTTAVPEAAPTAEKQSVSDLLAVNNARKAVNAKGDDDEDVAAPQKAGSRNSPAKTDAPPAPGQSAKNANGDPKAPADAMIGLGLKKAPVKEPEPDPFAKPKEIAAATSAEPIIAPVDFAKMDQTKEVGFSRGLNMPGWRVRDVNVDNSKTIGEHRGRKDVLVLNPLNDQLPSKLIATIEIPKDYAQRRPVLRFEVSGKDGTHDWVLGVKALNIDIMQKQVIKTKDINWIDTGVELAGLAGKRFEVSIECSMIPRTKQPKFAEQLCYIRNVRLEWNGKQPTPAK